ncbi:MAG: formylglycine-generating enzyme family protein, partial [Gloeotrichia echinulata HAB0833]
GTTTPFHFGETITTDLANYDGTSTYGSAPKGKYRKETTDVGSFPANAFGLYDMHGNVWEWCDDKWHKNYINAPSDGSSWLGENDNTYRLLRGGSWNLYPAYCRSASRGINLPDLRSYNAVGFRVVCVGAAART